MVQSKTYVPPIYLMEFLTVKRFIGGFSNDSPGYRARRVPSPATARAPFRITLFLAMITLNSTWQSARAERMGLERGGKRLPLGLPFSPNVSVLRSAEESEDRRMMLGDQAECSTLELAVEKRMAVKQKRAQDRRKEGDAEPVESQEEKEAREARIAR